MCASEQAGVDDDDDVCVCVQGQRSTGCLLAPVAECAGGVYMPGRQVKTGIDATKTSAATWGGMQPAGVCLQRPMWLAGCPVSHMLVLKTFVAGRRKHGPTESACSRRSPCRCVHRHIACCSLCVPHHAHTRKPPLCPLSLLLPPHTQQHTRTSPPPAGPARAGPMSDRVVKPVAPRPSPGT